MSTSSIYLRIRDANDNTLKAGKVWGYGDPRTTKQIHIDEAKLYDRNKIRFDVCEYVFNSIDYPVKVQVIKKVKHRNGNMIKKVIYEKIIE